LPACGAVVSGLDLAGVLDDDVIAEIRRRCSITR
jgi:hypothetical protein